MLVIEMEIRPTQITTEILSEIINGVPLAYACISGDHIRGHISFYCFQGTVIIYEIHGMDNDGVFGFHIHEGTSCQNDTNMAYEKTFGHYNPTQQEHPYHLGDLPPLFASRTMAWAIIYVGKFKPEDVIGKTIVIHQNADDFHTQPSGNSGTKIACGEIKRFE